MSRRPNFAFAATQALSGVTYGSEANNTNGSYKPTSFSKPFDGFKTTNITGNYNPKSLDAGPAKYSSAATYSGGGISVSAIEKNIKRDIQELDWELEATKKNAGASKGSEQDAQLKPRLFQKKPAHTEKHEFNNTGETRATVSNTVPSSDWDLPDLDYPKPAGKISTQKVIGGGVKKSATTAGTDLGKATDRSSANDWDLGESQHASKPQIGGKVNLSAKQK
jgi:hypothetical protein